MVSCLVKYSDANFIGKIDTANGIYGTCTHDLFGIDCGKCLDVGIHKLQIHSHKKRDARFIYGSYCIRFELYNIP